jgi:hypothetical protein
VPATCPYLEPDQSVHASTSHFLSIPFNIIPHPRLGLPSCLFPTKSPQQNPVLLPPIRATYPAHLIPLDTITRKLFAEEYSSYSYSLRSLLHSPVTSSLLGPNILLNTLFSNTLRLGFSLNVNDQVSHPHKTKGEITVRLYLNSLKYCHVEQNAKSYHTASHTGRHQFTQSCTLLSADRRLASRPTM